MKPLVSILIPAYNSEHWIAETLESALAQTWPNKEIIVVNDGSKDDTLSVLRRFESRGVVVVDQKNAGAAAARNKAFEASKGDYIQWLDADDLLSPDKIALQMASLDGSTTSRTLLSSGWGYFMYRPQRAQFNPTPLWDSLTPLEWLQRKWEGNLHMQTATWLVSRELTQAAGPWNTQLLGDDDGEYFFRIIRASDGIRFVPGAKVYYRVSAGNRLSYIGRSDRKMEAQFHGMKLQIGYLRAMDDGARTRAACVTYLQTWSHHFYPERMDLFNQAQALATELGGDLHVPQMSWKYAWIQKLFGWDAAKNVQLQYNQLKTSFLRAWDRAMCLASSPTGKTS